MKTDLDLQGLGKTILDRAARKRDFIADTKACSFELTEPTAEKGRDVVLAVEGETFEITDHAHGQIAERIGIPQKYYRKMQAMAPDMLACDVSQWFKQEPERRMIRALDKTARAWLSDRYHRLDDDRFAQIVLPAIYEVPGAEVVSCSVTDTKTHIKFKSSRLEREVKVGDAVQFGIAFSNSEVGAGALSGSLFIYRLVCTNGMVSPEDAFRQSHLGGKREVEERIMRLDTLKADGEATILKLRDYVSHLLNDKVLDAQVEKMREAAGIKIEKPRAAVEQLAKANSLTEGEQDGILMHLLRGGDMTSWGLINAVTRSAEDQADYNKATSLESLGGRMLADLPAVSRLAKAA